jgi:hypothetical protein
MWEAPQNSVFVTVTLSYSTTEGIGYFEAITDKGVKFKRGEAQAGTNFEVQSFETNAAIAGLIGFQTLDRIMGLGFIRNFCSGDETAADDSWTGRVYTFTNMVVAVSVSVAATACCMLSSFGFCLFCKCNLRLTKLIARPHFGYKENPPSRSHQDLILATVTKQNKVDNVNESDLGLPEDSDLSYTDKKFNINSSVTPPELNWKDLEKQQVKGTVPRMH